MDKAQRYINEKKDQERAKKIYISGGITHNPQFRDQFANKQMELKEQGWIVLSPLMIDAELTWEEYMSIDLAMVEVADAIYMMKGWESSRGASIEYGRARTMGKEVIFEGKE